MILLDHDCAPQGYFEVVLVLYLNHGQRLRLPGQWDNRIHFATPSLRVVKRDTHIREYKYPLGTLELHQTL